MSEPHDVVKLLAARMESHPEEFAPDGEGRWAQWLDELIPFVTEAERVLLRGPMMQTFHEQVLDELMNGPERRRKEAEEQEYERNLKKSLMLTQQQMMQQAQQGLQNAYSNAYDVDRDMYRSAGITHIAGQGPSLKAGITTQPTLSTSAINQIKQALGIKK
jgi:hypothetical protein